MKNKIILKLFIIILGVMMLFASSKVQASEITSIFTGNILTRSNLKTVSEINTLSSDTEVVPITLGIEQSEYKTNNGNVYWAIKDSSGTYKDIYCLNLSRGFGAPNGNITDSNNTKEYTDQYNLNNIANTEYETLTGLTTENKNKILWILNNISTSEDSLSTILKLASEKVDVDSIGLTNKDIEQFIKNDMQLNDRESTKLTFDDIKIVQQIVIWHYTNSGSLFDNTISAICDSKGNQISGLMDENINTDGYGTYIWNGKVKQAKLNALYQYFIDGAESGTSQTIIPELTLSNTNVTVTESGDNYIVGPFSLTGENTSAIKDITANISEKYTLLDSSKKEVSNNDFSKVIGSNFYLKIAKTEITETTNIELSLEYKYDIKELIFLTDKDDPTNTQPVVLVKSIEKSNNINTNATIELSEVIVEKVWEDNNNQDGVRPSNVKVQLYKNGVTYGEMITLNEKNNWTYTWEKLLKDNYTVKEINEQNKAVGDNEAYNDDYIATYVVSGNKTTITNTHEPEKISKTVIKSWDDNDNQDGIRPDSIKVTLYKTIDGTKQKIEEKELNKSNDFTYTWDNLDKYEKGIEIIYTVEETVPDNYKAIYSEDTFEITNKYIPGIISKTVIKEWDDEDNVDGIRPEEVTVQLYADGEEYGESIVLNKERGFTYTWTNLPEKKDGVAIDYTVSEIKIGKEKVENNEAAAYTVTYKVEGNITTITNTHAPDSTDKTVTKIWNDNDNKNNTRPEEIKVQLYANSEEYGKPITLTSGEDKVWQTKELSYTWTDLPLNKDGENIIYTVKELDSEGNPIENGSMYDGKYITTYSEDTFTITNTYKEFDLSLRKFITQINEQTYLREPVVDTSSIASTGTATYKHTKQPIAVQKGDIVTYTIRVYNEGEVDGYVDEITDYLPANLLPIIDGIEGIDSEKYKEEIEFNTNWLWEYSGNGNVVKTQITKADKATNLPGIPEEEQEEARLLKAYVDGEETLDYIDVQIKCLVTDKVTNNEYLTNIAEITESQDINGVQGDGNDSKLENVDYSNLSDYKNEEAINSDTNSYVKGQEDDDDFEKLVVKEFDLSLRKFITKVNETSHSRQPVVDTSKLGTTVDGKLITTAIYNHSKDPVIVETDDMVTYTIRIYNEGTLAGFANEITDDIPEGLEFLPNSDINISYKWKMLDKEGNETEDVSKAVMIVTDYLSDADKNNIINAVSEVDGVKTLSYKDVEVQFKVIAKAEKLQDNLIINEAQISADSDRDIDSEPNRDEKYDYTTGNNEDDIDYEPIKLQYFDLALRKFITKVNAVDYNNRYPEVVYNEDGSITYNHTKDPVLVTTNDVVVYTIRVYNEGEKAGYATEITDNLPDGLQFILDNEINKQYGWKLIDSEGNITEDVAKATKFTTDYLKDELIDALVIENGSKILTYKDVQIAFKVVEPNTSDRILVNTAEISNDSDDDVDSVPGNEVLTEDDIDKEYVKVQYFDLSLKKWVTKTMVTYNGKTTTTKTGFTEDSEEMAKVDLVASKMSKTTVKFAYNIKVTNEGELPGYAYEVKDYIPKGLKFVAADNKDWKELEDGTVVTDKLKDTLLNPGESATVEIVLTWKNSTTNMGVKTNYAEISNDSAEDIDSTPDNYNKQEDDIDDAQVILSIKTAGAPTYIGLIFMAVAILTGGIFLIKKYVIE